MKLLYLLVVGMLFAGCNSNAKSRTNLVSEKNEAVEKQAKFSCNWISLEYLSCLGKDLPCGCLDGIEYILIEYDVEAPNDIKLYEPRLNAEELIVKASDNDNFDVYTHPEASDVFLSFTIVGDTMYVNNRGITKKFIRYSMPNEKLRGAQLIGKLNIVMLKNLLNSKGFDIEKELNINEEYQLHCNVELDYLNLLYRKGDCNNKWIIEKVEDKVFVYKYTNSCEAKTHPIVVDKELIHTISIK